MISAAQARSNLYHHCQTMLYQQQTALYCDSASKIGAPLKQWIAPPPSSMVRAVVEAGPVDVPPRFASVAPPQNSAKNRLYKTELCRSFQDYAKCNYGDRCQYAHGVGDLRQVPRHPKYKTELCRTFHNSGFCPYGARCHFRHGEAAGAGGAPKLSPLTVLAGGGSVGDSPQPSSVGSSSPPVFSPTTSLWDDCWAPRQPSTSVSSASDAESDDALALDMLRRPLPAPVAPPPVRLPVFARLCSAAADR